ncbi:MAG: hypothetical protein V4750_04220, partial [Pseudomonadota bacterium]
MPRRSVLAIDPGPTESAFVEYSEQEIRCSGKVPNHVLLARIECAQYAVDCLAIEMIASYGMPVGAEVFETVLWIGRFMQRALNTNIREEHVYLIKRLDVKLNCCKSPKANDSNIRQAMIDRWGGEEKALGAKKCGTCKGRCMVGLGKKRGDCPDCKGSGWALRPGPLYNIKADVWAALALAVTWWDTKA